VVVAGDPGLPGLDLQPGDHICAFYFGPAERDEVLLPFLRAGLRAGDKCLCVIDSEDPSAMLAKLGDEHDSFGDLAPDQLEVCEPADSYLRGGRFETDTMIDFLDESASAATKDGPFDFMRSAGEMSWVLSNPPGADQLLEYESEINRFVPRYPQLLMCMYDLQRFGGGLVVDLLKTHPKLLLGGMVLDNPHYLSPDEFRAARA
jgi:hypothetical protein